MLILDLAAIYTPLILTILRFGGLVKNPQETLAGNLAIILAVTITPCLFTSTKGHALQSLISLLVIVFPIVYITVILMGAPLTTHIAETVLFSSHLTVMAFFTAVNELGLKGKNWLALLPEVQHEDVAEVAAVRIQKSQPKKRLLGLVWGTLIGAYLGAVPIPLDWDRDWQRWPVTVHVGACIGLALGGTIQLVYDSTVAGGISTKGKTHSGKGR